MFACCNIVLEQKYGRIYSGLGILMFPLNVSYKCALFHVYGNIALRAICNGFLLDKTSKGVGECRQVDSAFIVTTGWNISV